MNDHLLVNTRNMALTCAHCGTVEPTSNVVAQALDHLNKFTATHATCPKPVFKPGDRVEFCGDQATVVENYGTSGVVDLGNNQRVRWYWIFEGTPVIPVREEK